MTGFAPAALVGAGVGWSVLLLTHGWRATRPHHPLMQALLEVVDPSQTTAMAPRNRWTSTLRQWADPGVQAAIRLAGGREALSRRLHQAGRRESHSSYLWSQMGWASAVAALGLLLMVGTGSGSDPVRVLLAVGVCLLLGALARDWWLTREIARRRAVVADQFPVAAELFALSLSGGYGPTQAVEHVASVLGGPLGEHWQDAVTAVAAGERFATAMRSAAGICGHPPLGRFTDAMVSAMDRGTALAETARAQAVDARAEGHRTLMEAAGRKDVAMLVPVVFLVLPLVVIIALFPGAVELGMLG